ncbi:7-dimethylallyltryptophan synthase [Colletotrichum orbiculare MAFF 240422]|uniref:7-dimethylallyltryptophan synthase n=1 Tax=Colletotrichum orbiculare (strain 104-T / ATCC 96160 / CBS 514.97 / LARS 414 / MAFF 240422) TaxID=1213857 RepID=N4V4A8_COLOR|nr:7-dimethylallyltryptophan synthase [Colletotrichum orbiculare MAFF 240422]
MVAATLDPESVRAQEDSKFWWSELSPPLLSLMQSAGYSAEEQDLYADFVNQFVVPSLGPEPRTSKSGARVPHFDSFCSDDFSPAELSWNVGPKGYKIRVGSEPIGAHAGTTRDPFNQDEPDAVMARLLRLHGGRGAVDGRLWDVFKRHMFVDARHAETIVSRMAANEHMTTNTISFDLEGEHPAPKVYFYPIPVSLLRDTHAGDVIAETLQQLPLNVTPSLRHITDFLARHNRGRAHGAENLRPELVAFDAVAPELARFKIYVRTKATCMARVRDIYTLGGALGGPLVEGGLDLIRLFYLHVLGLTAPEEELPASSHRTAGIIFNMEIKHNQARPVPKVYIPVRHYGGTDLRIAQNLSAFFRACGFAHMAETYVDAVQKAFCTQDFSTTIGRHSYVGLSFNKAGPYITMYYNTMTFSAGDERDAAGKLVGPAAWKQRHLLD